MLSTYVLMRILESAPDRYELGIRLLTFGSLDRAYDRLASQLGPRQRVLDLGCGTGALALRAARRGAAVRGIDPNAGMLEVADRRAREAGLSEKVELVEMGAAELDREPAEGYDAVTCGLCLSELSRDELDYTLKQLMRILRPGGLLLVGDEVRPRGLVARILHRVIRAPLVVLTFLVTQQTTHPIAGLEQTLLDEGFSIEAMRSGALGSFREIVARKPEPENA